MSDRSSLKDSQLYLEAAKTFAQGFTELNQIYGKNLRDMADITKVIQMNRVKDIYNTYCEIFAELNKTVLNTAEEWAEVLTKQANARSEAGFSDDSIQAFKSAANALKSIQYIKIEEDTTTYSDLSENFERAQKEELGKIIIKIMNQGQNYYDSTFKPKFTRYSELNNIEDLINRMDRAIKNTLAAIKEVRSKAGKELVGLQDILQKLNLMDSELGGSLTSGSQKLVEKSRRFGKKKN